MKLKKMKKNCELCRSQNLIKVLDLGFHPLCDDLILINSKRKNKLYKIEIIFCKKCLTAHQKYQVKKKVLFPKNYHYRARFTNDVLIGMKNLVSECEKYLGNINGKTVLDIGCNDGSLLNFFKKKGCVTLGVEPTNAHKDADRKKHKIYNNYFDNNVVKSIKKKFKEIDIITFTNVFAHIEDIRKLIKNLKSIISNKTLIVIENHYMGAILDNKQFDTFYHEHPRTYSLKSFIYISKLLGLKILKVNFPKRYGGNIRVTMGQKKRIKVKSLRKKIKSEFNFFKKFKKFEKQINIWRTKKNKLIHSLYKKHGRLSAKALPGRATILIKLLGINEKIISAVYEKPKSMKIGHYVPGTRIPIKSDKILFKNIDKEKVILNLAWHLRKEIKNYLKFYNFKGKVVNILDNSDFIKTK